MEKYAPSVIGICLFIALSHAHPGYLPPTPSASLLPAAYETIEYSPAVVGHTVHTIPTAVSHQSQTIVHEKRPYLRPIVHHTPILRAYPAASYRTVAVPVSVPLSAYSPLPYSGLYDHGWSPDYGDRFYGGWNEWPLK